MWGATLSAGAYKLRGCISIHAPRVGSDASTSAAASAAADFNPRSPCGERREREDELARPWQFQSTLPVWGATFVPRFSEKIFKISIHAPRVGSDGSLAYKPSSRHSFQSTLPVWGATHPNAFLLRVDGISIHAPRVGSDNGRIDDLAAMIISIHAPRVGSDETVIPDLGVTNVFQSTLPVWGAT